MPNRVRKSTRRRALQYLGTVGVVGLAGCAGGGNQNSGGSSGNQSGGGSASNQSSSSSAGQSSNSGQEIPSDLQDITALGGITGGSGYQQCLVFQQIMQSAFSNIRVTVSGTSGWKTDAKLMWSQGEASGQFGIVPAGDAYNILHGNKPYNSERNYVVQAYPAVPPTYIQTIVPKKSDIKGYQDLNGKTVNILSRGSTTAAVEPKILKSVGVENVNYQHYPHKQAASALKRGDIDAAAAAGIAAPYQSLSQNMPLRVISVSDSDKQQISKSIPSIGFSTLNFNEWYKGSGKTRVPAPWTVMGCLLNLPKSFVYKITKAVFNNLETAAKIYDPASELSVDDAPKTRVPVHPGSYKFFKEKGVKFPENMKPPKKSELPLKG